MRHFKDVPGAARRGGAAWCLARRGATSFVAVSGLRGAARRAAGAARLPQ